ncbi:hypothetical protein PsAD26_05233 [Pseudovibrio sp. Ad26]|nr:hypothetical protein PsAD26_05233 [Pseudovibrio sp. Ad26]
MRSCLSRANKSSSARAFLTVAKGHLLPLAIGVAPKTGLLSAPSIIWEYCGELGSFKVARPTSAHMSNMVVGCFILGLKAGWAERSFGY